jgi:hypothetical protein
LRLAALAQKVENPSVSGPVHAAALNGPATPADKFERARRKA